MEESALKSLLEPKALERLFNIQMVKPEKFEILKSRILSLYQSRQLTTKLTEGQLIAMLESTSTQQSKIQVF